MTGSRLNLRLVARGLVLGTCLFTFGCASVALRGPSNGIPSSTVNPPERAYSADLKSRLIYIVERKLNEKDGVANLKGFKIDEYDIQDQGTFWGHSAVGAADGPYSEYYLTFKGIYFIMFLKDEGNGNQICIDLKMIPKTKKEYELSTGRVVIDGKQIDERVVVIFNKYWKADFSTDIVAAFRPNIDTGKIESVEYKTIKIYREE